MSAILELRDQPELRKQFGVCGREIARGYSADAMCRKYLDIYQAMTAGE
jgi:glycosyltransferase involved in cell wall biosynthesis